EYGCRRQIVHMQKFAARLPRSPNYHLAGSAHFSFVRLAQQRGQRVRSLQIEIITRAVEICWHNRDEIRAVLACESLTQFYARDLCNCICFVRRFRRPAEQRTLRNWLRSKLRINARTAEK